MNKSNADHAVLFESIALVVSYGPDAEDSLRDSAHALLGRFIGVNDANVRYLGLDMLTRCARQDGPSEVQR